MNEQSTVANRIKLIRKKHNMTQVNFAQSLAISQANLSEIESGKSKPPLDVLILLVIKYKADLHWLLLNEKELYKKGLPKDELELLIAYQQLQDVVKEEVHDFIKLKLKRYKKKPFYGLTPVK